MAKACNSFKTGGKNFYEIVNFLKACYRLRHSLALEKVSFLKKHFLSPVQKKIFPYIQNMQTHRACPTTG